MMEQQLIFFKNNLTCPLSKMIFLNPVIAEDGFTYEDYFINSWLEKQSTSPITHKQISKTTTICFTIKEMVEYALNNYPCLKESQFSLN